MARTMKTVEAETADQWRGWLSAHHDREAEVWLVFYKQHTGRACIAYEDSVDEALCFGWVDSLVKRIDDARYARKFTPRRADSVWSDSNRKRYAELVARGRLAPPGEARAPTHRRPPDAVVHKTTTPPPYIEQALNKHARARKAFDALAPSHKKNYIAWIDSAKREETKQKRLKEAIRMLAAGKVLTL